MSTSTATAALLDQADFAGTDLKGLMSQVLQHLTVAERRNETLLVEMKERLEALSTGARMTRARVPNDYLPGFHRIEDGIHLLAERIAESYTARQAAAVAVEPIMQTPSGQHGFVSLPAGQPAAVAAEAYVPPSVPAMQAGGRDHVDALSSTSPGLLRARTTAYAADVDTFDVIESLPGNPTEAWSADEAAALSQVYSTREALFAPTGATELHSVAEAGTADRDLSRAAPELSGTDRNWIDQRLSDIATRVERSLASRLPDAAFGSFEHRFDDLEHRLTAKLDTVATTADLEGLKAIEDQIHTLRTQFEQAHIELMRIDDLERQLGHLVHQVSEENLTAVISRAIPAPNPAIVSRADVEFHGVAIAAAEAAAARVARLQGTGRVDDVHALLSNFISERRQGEEQTAITLDTLQQAMLRILDRVEAFEHGGGPGLSPRDGYLHDAYPHGDIDLDETAHTDHDHDARQPLDYAYVQDPDHESMPPTAAATSQPDAALASAAVVGGDYLSQQRAKMQASVQRAAAAQRDKAKTALEVPAAGENARTQRAVKPAANGGSSRLMVSMLALAVMAGGAAAIVMSLTHDDTRPIALAPPSLTGPSQVAGPAVGALSNPRRSQAVDAVGSTVPGPDRLVPGRDAATPAFPNPQPATVTDDIGQGSRVPEIDRVPEVNSVRANVAKSQYTVPSVVSGVLLQKSAANEPEDVRAVSSPAASPAAISIAAHPGDLPATALEAVETEQPRSSLELPPATVGPLSLRLAAARGDKSAQFEVASRLAEGKGTDQNLKEAVRWYQRSATQGFAQAQYRLGTFYERGLGVKADVGRARTWYQRAAEQGNVKAMHNLAVLAAGRSAESPDYGTAAHWFTQAAGYGLADSQFNLAVLTESGLGLEKDLVQAAMWFSVAARSGDKEAIRRRDLMKTKLQPAELAKADVLAKAWQPLVQEKLANDPHTAGEAWKSVQAQPAGHAAEN